MQALGVDVLSRFAGGQAMQAQAQLAAQAAVEKNWVNCDERYLAFQIDKSPTISRKLMDAALGPHEQVHTNV